MRCLECHKDGVAREDVICPHCGVHLPSARYDVLPIQTRVGKGVYEIDDYLGRGGFGITYRAFHRSLDMPVAIKEFYPREFVTRNTVAWDLKPKPGQEEAYRRNLDRFVREGRLMAVIENQHVVRATNMFEERDTAYLVMDLIIGRTLSEEIKMSPGQRLPEERVIEVMSQLVLALESTHRQQIFHLDLKPDNVMVTPEGRVVLVDFGAARQGFSSRSTQAYTLEYAPLEVMDGKTAGPYSDIFELGMMLHQMLTGKLPPTAVSRLREGREFMPVGLSEPWASLIASALKLNERDRPRRVAEWWGYESAHRQKFADLRRGREERLRRSEIGNLERVRRDLAEQNESLESLLRDARKRESLLIQENEELKHQLKQQRLMLREQDEELQRIEQYKLVIAIAEFIHFLGEQTLGLVGNLSRTAWTKLEETVEEVTQSDEQARMALWFIGIFLVLLGLAIFYVVFRMIFG